MDRRSFVLSLFGGLAAASVGGATLAQAASPKRDAVPAAPTGKVDAALKTQLDELDTEFTQYHGHRRHRPPVHRRRPPVVHRPIHRGRRVVRHGRVYYVR